MIKDLKSRLLASRNPDGGWPYYAGKTSRLEPTAWALLALQAAGETMSADVLTSWPRREGWFVDRSSDAVNVAFNALAGIALAAAGASPDALRPVRDSLVRLKGQTLPPSKAVRQDNSLQAWPWLDGTFSWSEPTAWSMIFLKRVLAGERDEAANARLAEAERLLTDRVCRHGGWNFGNTNVLGADLDAYVPTTALGLLAMSDRRDLEPVQRSLKYLSAHRLSERSAMALGLTRIALGVFDHPAEDVDKALADAAAHTAFLGNQHLTAIALYALAGARGARTEVRAYEEFRV